MRTIRKRFGWGIVSFAVALVFVASAIPVCSIGHAQSATDGKEKGAAGLPHRTIEVQLLGINDFHGQLNVTRTVAGKPVGRADYLAAYLKQRAAANKNTLLVHAGDMVGASAPVSALLQDEPTIAILNRLGFDVGTVGNHEFDEGVDELLRLVQGGYHEKTGWFEGATFPYVCANVVDRDTGKPILPSYVIKRVNGMPIGFVGVVTTETPRIVMPSAVATLRFLDEAEAINRAVAELKEKGVRAIVVLAHVPGAQLGVTGEPYGEVVELARKIDDEVDVIFAGHSHAYLNAVVDGKLIVQAYAYGTAFADVDLAIDPRTKDVVAKRAEIVTTFHEGMAPDPEIRRMIEEYEERVAPIVNRVVGTAAQAITREQNESGESALGNLIADAQRQAMQTDFAFLNPGGIRADLDAGDVTWGELYTIQPFNNTLVRMTLTGEQIRRLLNQQWQENAVRMLQVSGLRYTWDAARPVGDRVVDIFRADGTPLDPQGLYTVTVNSFLAEGGDGFTVLRDGTDRVYGPEDIEALVAYIERLPQPFSAAIEGRIQRVN